MHNGLVLWVGMFFLALLICQDRRTDGGGKLGIAVAPHQSVHHALCYSRPTDTYVPGCYALQVDGKLPKATVSFLNKKGVRFRNADQYR